MIELVMLMGFSQRLPSVLLPVFWPDVAKLHVWVCVRSVHTGGGGGGGSLYRVLVTQLGVMGVQGVVV